MTRGRARTVGWVGLFAACVWVSTPAHADEVVPTHIPKGQQSNGVWAPLDRDLDVFLIRQPRVTQPWKEYDSVKFYEGDRVWVIAGGCVARGGCCFGKYSNRYVDPRDGGSDRFHAGTIEIPHAIGAGAGRIKGIMGQLLTIGPIPNAGYTTLKLGYEDEAGKYDDNGYGNLDDGNNNECKGEGPAWVEIRIARQPKNQPPPPPPPPVADMDLWSANFDYNDLPFNPIWGAQYEPPSLPHPRGWIKPLPGPDAGRLCNQDPVHSSCTSQAPTEDTQGADLRQAMYCHGRCQHANWWPVTYTGALSWDGHDSQTGSFFNGDNDYNIYIKPEHGEGQTKNSPDGIKCEFDSGETVNHFKTSWWQKFHDAVDNSDKAAHDLIDGKKGIAVGLMGLDCVQHGSGTFPDLVVFDYNQDCHPELHPTHALAIQIDTNGTDEHWAMFGRNWGGEGGCSQNQHFLDRTTIEFEIPHPRAVAVVDAGSTFMANGVSGTGKYSIELIPGEGAVVALELPTLASTPQNKGDVGPFIEGLLALKWTTAPGIEPVGPRPVAPNPNASPQGGSGVPLAPNPNASPQSGPGLAPASGGPAGAAARVRHANPNTGQSRMGEVLKQMTPPQQEAYRAAMKSGAVRATTHAITGQVRTGQPQRWKGLYGLVQQPTRTQPFVRLAGNPALLHNRPQPQSVHHYHTGFDFVKARTERDAVNTLCAIFNGTIPRGRGETQPPLNCVAPRRVTAQ
jgi:hypothetical protein